MRAYRRVIKRWRYRRSCQCAAAPALRTAAAPSRLIPKGILGISIWVTVLIDKYLLYRPTYRLLADLRAHGLDLAQGTVTDGLRRLAPLFAPLREALIARSRRGEHWHADETSWQVFEADSEDAGWSVAQREARLQLVVNNARFLILPWVQVRNLASTVLARISRRLPDDWQARYGYRPLLLETFVQSDRFAGTSYRAANWTHVGGGHPLRGDHRSE